MDLWSKTNAMEIPSTYSPSLVLKSLKFDLYIYKFAQVVSNLHGWAQKCRLEAWPFALILTSLHLIFTPCVLPIAFWRMTSGGMLKHNFIKSLTDLWLTLINILGEHRLYNIQGSHQRVLTKFPDFSKGFSPDLPWLYGKVLSLEK